jgi:hypothetical protein
MIYPLMTYKDARRRAKMRAMRLGEASGATLSVIAGLVPTISITLAQPSRVQRDGRDKPGRDAMSTASLRAKRSNTIQGLAREAGLLHRYRFSQ